MSSNRNTLTVYENLTTEELDQKLATIQEMVNKYKAALESPASLYGSMPPYLMISAKNNYETEPRQSR